MMPTQPDLPPGTRRGGVAMPWLGEIVGAALMATLLLGGLPAAAQPAMVDGSADSARGEDASRPDTAPAGGPPVISSEDSGVGEAVMDGPSEQAGTFSGWDEAPMDPGEAPSAEAAPDDEMAGADAAAASPASPAAPADAAARTAEAELVPGLPGSATLNRLVAAGSAIAQIPQRSRAASNPVVVELFTSQGCSSCPAADALMGELAGRPDVLTLSFHVDYWDYLGWPDHFARPEFTARQRAYGMVTGERALYTPQIVVGGLDTLIDLGPTSLETLIDSHRAEPSPVAMHVDESGGKITVDLWPGRVPTGPSTVELVRFLPSREVTVDGGENHGKVLAYRNIVVSVDRLATWDGRAPLRLTVTPGAGGAQPLPSDTRHAVLVQQLVRKRGLGPVLAAVPID